MTDVNDILGQLCELTDTERQQIAERIREIAELKALHTLQNVYAEAHDELRKLEKQSVEYREGAVLRELLYRSFADYCGSAATDVAEGAMARDTLVKDLMAIANSHTRPENWRIK